MITVRLICRVPVASTTFKWFFRISDTALTAFMYVEPKRPYRALGSNGRSVRGQSSHVGTDHSAVRSISKVIKPVMDG